MSGDHLVPENTEVRHANCSGNRSKEGRNYQHQWLMPIILGTWEAEMGRIMV
jgi:hypothetical protein